MARPTSRSRLGRFRTPTLLPEGVASNVPTVAAPEDPLRSGMPALDAIHARIVIASPQMPGKAVVSFISPSGRKYRIIKTRELDAYDKPPQ